MFAAVRLNGTLRQRERTRDGIQSSDSGPKGSLFLTRPTLFDYTADRESLEWRSSDVFKWIDEGKLSLRLEHFVSLADAPEAHQALEGRKTAGKIILTP